MPARWIRRLCVWGALAAATPAAAQQFTGTYAMANAQGGTITLVLEHAANGQLTGSMSGNGAQFRVEGVVDAGTAMGALTSADGGVFFEATLDGDQLTLVLIEAGAGNMPDYSKTRSLVLTRAAGRPGAGANPRSDAIAPDPLAGSYAGAGVSLVLQGSGGVYQGSITVQGATYPAQARGQGGKIDGNFTAGGQTYPFTATLSGDRLTLESDGAAHVLVRQGAAGNANPLAAPGAAGAGAPPTLQGRWACRTGQGTAQLAFLSDRELAFNGERAAYELVPGVIRVAGEWGPVDYRYQLTGDALQVTGPDGSEMQCQRQETGAAGGAGGGDEALLQGQICAFSSSADGGYSTLYKLYFDGQGRFLHGTESSYSGDPGAAYGLSNNPDAGSYRVGGNTKGAPIQMVFPDGSSATAYVYFVDDETGRILEIQLNGRLYGRSLCQ